MSSSKNLTHVNASNVNALSLDSTFISTHPITAGQNRRVLDEIIDGIFDERKGTCDISSSQCSSLKIRPSEYSYDNRLKYWKDVIKDREKLSNKIRQRISKEPAEILYNRLTTTEERDKQTIKRILDYADRMNPVELKKENKACLHEKYNNETSHYLPEIHSTLPRAERDEKKIVEITGLPNITKLELMGKRKHQGVEKSYSWLKSKILEKRIEEKRVDIERVIEFYPDVENLQVVGESLIKSHVKPKHNSDIKLIQPLPICEISSESLESANECLVEKPQSSDTELIEYALKINDYNLTIAHKRITKNIEFETNFSSHPFGRDIKKVMALHNIGQKILNLEWCHRSYYGKGSALLKSRDDEFVFDNQPFRLCSGEKKEILVLYQPRKVKIVKSKWILKIDPPFFCRKVDGIVMRLSGICKPHPEYEKKLNELQNEVLEKSNIKMMRKLTTNLADIAPKLEPFETVCPYQRALNDLELFEQLNPGYRCERYHVLELLKDLYGRAKKPRDKTWDFKVDSLKYIVLQVEDANSRSIFFNELCSILDPIKEKSLDLEQRLLDTSEKIRARLLYARGMVGASIDEWLLLRLNLEKALIENKLHDVNGELTDQQHINQEEAKATGDTNPSILLENKTRNLTTFRDSLYMLTYTLLCDITENIVNIIESTEFI